MADMGMMLKMFGIDASAVQQQIGAFGQGVKEFDAKLNGIMEAHRILDAKLDALYRLIDDRMPTVQPGDFPHLDAGMFNGGPKMPVMVIGRDNGGN